MSRIRFAILIAAAMVARPSVAGELTLVQDGKPNAVLVVAADVSPPAGGEQAGKKVAAKQSQNQRAAEALQTYIERMSGAELPIVEEGQPLEPEPAVQVLVGHTQAAKKLRVKIPGGFNPAMRQEIFEEEGYVLKTKGASLVVAGNSDGPYQGTLYAAYALLERLGCRWYFPGEWGQIVPKRTTVTVPELDVLSRPDFAIRLAGSGYKDDWGTKIGLSSGVGYPVAADGSLGRLLPPAEYAESHPEYYAMNKQGQRPTTAESKPHSTMLCLSNPDVLTAGIEAAKAAFAGKKKVTCVFDNGVGISPPDGAPFCYCDPCLAASQNFNYPTYIKERMMSEEYCGFAAKLAQAFPDKWVGLSAYSLRVVPPQGVALPPNVAVNLFPISTCALHAGDDPACWRRQETMKIATSWRRLTPHVTMCHYAPGLLSVYGAGQRAMVPERDTAVFAVEAPLLKEMGFKGCRGASWVRGQAHFMSTWLSFYVRGKLTWNVTTNVAALKKEFYATFFGPAAGPHVQAWWDACEDALARSTCHAHEDWVAAKHIYTVPFATKIHEHVEAALKSEASPEQRDRIAAFALIADHLEAYAAMNEAESRLDYPRAIAESERMAENVRKLSAISSHLGAAKLPEAQTEALKRVAGKVDGTEGVMVAPVPLETKFTRDRFNEGVLAEWYAPDFDDSAWKAKSTFLTWDQQDPPEDARGHDYDGYGWYRAALEIDKRWAGKPLRLYLVGAINEAWVWVNGQYAGHRPHKLWWHASHRGGHSADLDVSGMVAPGGRNVIAIRVWNNAEIGGLYRRGFLYSPTAAELEAGKTE